MRRLRLVAGLVVLVGALAACNITVTYTPPPSSTAVVATTSDTTPVASGVTVQPNSTRYYDVSVPSAVSAYPLIYAEANGNVSVSLISYTTYHTLASSSSADYFASGTLGLSGLSAGSSPAPQAVTANRTCLGPCVIWPTGASHYYVGIENTSSSAVSYTLYVYGLDYQDTTEPQNDHMNTAPVLSASDQGAIETLGDADYWRAAQTGNVSFTMTLNSSPVGLQAEVYDSTGAFVAGPYNPSTTSTFYVNANEYIKVYSANGYAGPSGTSGYTLSY